MARHEIRVKVGQKNMRDPQAPLGGKREVPVDVTLRVDDGCQTAAFVADDIRRVRKAIQIKLVRKHDGGSSYNAAVLGRPECSMLQFLRRLLQPIWRQYPHLRSFALDTLELAIRPLLLPFRLGRPLPDATRAALLEAR